MTQPKSAFDLRRMMDEGKILLVNLAKGRIGEDVAALLGAMLVSGSMPGFFASHPACGLKAEKIPEAGT